MSLLLRIRRGLISLAALCLASVVSYKLITGKGWLDSVYFFVITAATVGYGEDSTVAPEVQLLTIAIILTSTLTVGYTIGLIIQAMVEGQMNRALGVRRMTREIEKISEHAIICGYGRIGQTLADDLRLRNAKFVVIDQDNDIIREASDTGCLALTGDATDEEILLQAGIKRARTLVVAMHGDAENVFLTLTARNLAPDIRIIARGELSATEKKLRQAGADQVVLPAVIGARRMAAMVTRPYAAEMMEHFANQEQIDASLEELAIPEGNVLVGQSVGEVAAGQLHRLLVIGVRKHDGEMVFNPGADYRFDAGDTLIAMGKRKDISGFHAAYDIGADNA